MEQLVTNRLKQIYPTQNDRRTNLYEHLSLILPQLQQFQNQKISPISNLQAISQYFKKYQFRPSYLPSQHQLKWLIQSKILYPEWLSLQEQLQKKLKLPTDDIFCQNFQQKAERLLSKVGVGFGKEESFLIQTALKKIAQQKKATQIRFWGKIFTKTRDYIIIEGKTTQSNAGDAQGDVQKVNQGANYNCYWVSQNLLNDQWYELPLVTPEQIKTSRFIKYAFTGNLNNKINSSPPFKGLEKHLLKAQIVRITHNCQIVPKGLFAPLQENPDEVGLAEDFKMPEFAELSNLQNWVHFNPYILKIGRASYYVDPKVPEEQKEELLAKLAETDPKIERLKAINEDKGLQKFGLEGCWTVRTYGSTQVFNNVGKDQGTTSCYAVVTLRNPHWPGWVTVSSAKDYAAIYIGYGLKASQASFYPLGPEDISIQGQEVQECHEPNPKDPPDELEPDSDDQNKKPEE